ncbi:MAG: type II toxin-antitoxin system VapC family toxin [Methylohalobius sp.]|nr:type II toxin-antitoxin system VapC family toxin [Methylohalobius sp.]
MIVVDTNVIAYLYLPTEYTPWAEKLMRRDPVWVAPTLWRSELRNVLAFYVRKQALSFDQAYGIQTEAENLLAGHEFEMDSYEVLRLAETSRCSAYDCEFVALAKRLGRSLVTEDKKILQAFPGVAVSLVEAVA